LEFGTKIEIWEKIEIWDNNWNLGQKLKFGTTIGIWDKNWNLGHKLKLWSKTDTLVKNWNLAKFRSIKSRESNWNFGQNAGFPNGHPSLMKIAGSGWRWKWFWNFFLFHILKRLDQLLLRVKNRFVNLTRFHRPNSNRFHFLLFISPKYFWAVLVNRFFSNVERFLKT